VVFFQQKTGVGLMVLFWIYDCMYAYQIFVCIALAGLNKLFTKIRASGQPIQDPAVMAKILGPNAATSPLLTGSASTPTLPKVFFLSFCLSFFLSFFLAFFLAFLIRQRNSKIYF
jgi:hypothetical protein